MLIVSGTCPTQLMLVVVDDNRDLLAVNVEWREFYELALFACFMPKYSWIISLQLLYYLCKAKDKISKFILYLSSELDVHHVFLSFYLFLFIFNVWDTYDKCSSISGNVCWKLFCSIEFKYSFKLGHNLPLLVPNFLISQCAMSLLLLFFYCVT